MDEHNTRYNFLYLIAIGVPALNAVSSKKKANTNILKFNRIKYTGKEMY